MSESYDPQRMGRVLRLGMEEILGAEGLHSLLEIAGVPASEAATRLNLPAQDGLRVSAPFTEQGDESLLPAALAHVLAVLEQVYGPAAGRGLAQRIGRACFQYGLQAYGSTLGITSTSFRLLPLPSKLYTFAGALAQLFNGPLGQGVRVEERDGKLLWHMQACPLCTERHSDEPICLLAAGLAEESLYWLSGGKMFSVEEVTCIARGDRTCTLQVDETPLS